MTGVMVQQSSPLDLPVVGVLRGMFISPDVLAVRIV